MPRLAALLIPIAILATACAAEPTGPLPDPPSPVTAEAMATRIETGGTATVVNVWASWCLPCRSEAPLVAAASHVHPDIEFIGLNVRDDPGDAQGFMATYLSDAEMTHLSDRSGGIPVGLGGTNGVPLTFFYRADGTQAHVHLGIIDEPTMARYLDEIDR